MATKKTPKTTPEATAQPAAAKKTTRKPAARKPKTEAASEPLEIIVGVAPRATPAPNSASSASPLPTEEQIAHAAFLNYLHRVQNGLPGDSNADWLAAVNRLAA